MGLPESEQLGTTKVAGEGVSYCVMVMKPTVHNKKLCHYDRNIVRESGGFIEDMIKIFGATEEKILSITLKKTNK